MKRRDFLKLLPPGALAMQGGGLFLFPGTTARALSAGQPTRVLQFFLTGGWDTGLATDPVTGGKASSSVYATHYQNLRVEAVSQKPSLLVGEGLIPAKSAFASLNCCFVNGIHMEVTAHELAQNYMYSGVPSLSRSREFPAFIARIGTDAATFPPFVAIGEPLPLGDTRTNPPLHTQSPDQLSQMLNPFEEDIPKAVIPLANRLVEKLDNVFTGKQSLAMKEYLRPWQNSQARLTELYDKKYNLRLSQDIRDRYSITNTWEQNARIPASFLALKEGLSPFVTCSLDGYDTHSDHFNQHIPLMQGFSQRLALLVEDMKNTQDPGNPDLKLSDTTLIVVLSEFARTPGLNVGAGTDHWQTGSAIIMGPGVRDNQVIGATGDDALPKGWAGVATDLHDQTRILPDHLAKAVVKKLRPGLDTSELGEKSLDQIFE